MVSGLNQQALRRSMRSDRIPHLARRKQLSDTNIFHLGPGHPALAHTDEESVRIDAVVGCYEVLHRFATVAA